MRKLLIAVGMIGILVGCGRDRTDQEIFNQNLEDASQAPYVEELESTHEVITNLEVPKSGLVRVVVKDIKNQFRIHVVLGTKPINPGTTVKIISVDYMQNPIATDFILAVV